MPLNRLDFDEDLDPTLRPQEGGAIFVLKWIGDTWGEAVRERIGHLAFLYVFMLLGFVGLYVTMRSTAKLAEVRRNVATILKEQRARKFDYEDYRAMPGGGMYF